MFGFSKPSGVELPENDPQISDEDPIRSAIGQGTHAYTAAQLSKYITTIANRGVSYDLTLLEKIVDKDGKIVVDNKAKVDQKLTGIKQSTWDNIQQGLYSVVNVAGGSVYNNGLYRNLGVTVAGKTGTSQISKFVPNNALFVSYAPFEKPEISITTIIPNGHTSGNATELTRDIYKLYYNLGDHDKLVDKNVTLPENRSKAFSD
jgi:penicillin-binding protein 2